VSHFSLFHHFSCNKYVAFFDIDIEKKDKLIYNSTNLFLIQNKLSLSEILCNRKILKLLISYLRNEKNFKYHQKSERN